MNYAKALIAALAVFVSAFLLEWTGGEDVLVARDFVVAAAAALVSFGAVYMTPNRA